MSNQLANENSPYLLQHKDNPVDWFPWGEEALNKAKAENKPIFLSIGYAACHWCHVMEHESFEDLRTAEIMNQNFVNIKVDREERPDLDGIYMKAVVAMTGQGGWPMSVFLTPDGKPFFGGTYFPPVRRYNMPSFGEILLKVAQTWKEDQENVSKSSEQLTHHILEQTKSLSNPSTLNQKSLDEAVNNLSKGYDWKNGGWGKAPKFPQAMVIQFLLKRAKSGDEKALEISEHALRSMARGGLYDVVGGGFSRYSVDDEWLVPHFEKMLYDNAQLVRAYLHAYMINKDPFFKQIVEETLDFVSREMTNPEGGFYSSLDADSEGVEGKYYLWHKKEIEEILEFPEDIALFTTAYDLQDQGNFEGKIILQRNVSEETLVKQFMSSNKEIRDRLHQMHQKLYRAREKRVRPATDDKVLTSWNSLMLIAFAEAGRYLGREDYVEIAQKNAEFLLTQMHTGDRLLRSYRAGKSSYNAYLEDYASLILGLLALYQTDFNNRWYRTAEKLTKDMIKYYSDEGGGFFDTRKDHEILIARPKEQQDNATPSGNSLASQALLIMAAFSDNGNWYDLGRRAIENINDYLTSYPTGFGNWLCAADFALAEVTQIAVIGDLLSDRSKELTQSIWEEFRPNIILASSNIPLEDQSPALLKDRPLLDGHPTAYVCKKFICKQPVISVKGLKIQLSSSE